MRPADFDTSGYVGPFDPLFADKWSFLGWNDLTPFVQGMITRMMEEFNELDQARIGPLRFSYISPSALERLIEDGEAATVDVCSNQTSAGEAFWRARQTKFAKWGFPAIAIYPGKFPPFRISLTEGKIMLEEIV